MSSTIKLIGEDRSFGGNDLFIDLIPKTSWFKNVRKCLTISSWNKLRNYVYDRVDKICECCNKDMSNESQSLEAHERWEYNAKTNIQKLVRIIALCKICHLSTHIGYAGIIGKKQMAMDHLKKTRGFTDEELKIHRKEAFVLWRERNNVKWKIDISLMTKNGFLLKQSNFKYIK